MNAVFYLIGHQGGNRPSNFMILWSFAQRTEQDEKKSAAQRTRAWNICGILRSVFLQQHILPGGDGNFSQAIQQHSRGQADKRHHGAIEEFKLPHQDIRGLSTGRNLLHEVEIDLGDMYKKIKIWCRHTGSVFVCLLVCLLLTVIHLNKNQQNHYRYVYRIAHTTKENIHSSEFPIVRIYWWTLDMEPNLG